MVVGAYEVVEVYILCRSGIGLHKFRCISWHTWAEMHKSCPQCLSTSAQVFFLFVINHPRPEPYPFITRTRTRDICARHTCSHIRWLVSVVALARDNPEASAISKYSADLAYPRVSEDRMLPLGLKLSLRQRVRNFVCDGRFNMRRAVGTASKLPQALIGSTGRCYRTRDLLQERAHIGRV